MRDEIDYKQKYLDLIESYKDLLDESMNEYEAYNPNKWRKSTEDYFCEEIKILERIDSLND